MHAHEVDETEELEPPTVLPVLSPSTALPCTTTPSPSNGSPENAPSNIPPRPVVVILLILASVRFAEPVSFTSINPYIFFFISSFGIQETDIGFYAGLIFSAFPFAEFATSLLWVNLSNKIGRRQVILLCLAACILPTLLFGFSRNAREAMLWRTVTGLVNGNAPVIATAVAELVTYKPHQALAFSVVPVTWSIGAIIGPMLGGTLSDPVKQYPSLFPEDTPIRRFLLKFRFSLPSIVCAVLFSITFVVAYFGLPMQFTPRHGYGIPEQEPSERSPLLARKPSVYTIKSDVAEDQACEERKPASFLQEVRQLTRPIYLNLALSALVCFVTMSIDQIFPLLASTSRSLGGLALSSPQVGLIYTITSVAGITGQICFPLIHKRLGSRGCLLLASVTCLWTCLVFPNLVHVANWVDGGLQGSGSPAQQRGIIALACAALMLQRASGVIGFPSLFIALTNVVPTAAPSERRNGHARQHSLLGIVNGLMHATNCAFRGLGPLTMGPFWAWSIRSQQRWIFWATLACLAIGIAALNRKCRIEEEADQ